MVALHDCLKLCSDIGLPLWLMRKHHHLMGTLDEDVGHRIIEQAMDALKDPEDQGRSDNQGLDELVAGTTVQQGLDHMLQIRELESVDKVIPEVPNDDDRELLEGSLVIETGIRRGGVFEMIMGYKYNLLNLN